MTLAGVYGFWKYVSKLERRETRRYLEMFYILKFRDLVSIIFMFESYFLSLANQVVFMFFSSLSANLMVFMTILFACVALGKIRSFGN